MITRLTCIMKALPAEHQHVIMPTCQSSQSCQDYKSCLHTLEICTDLKLRPTPDLSRPGPTEPDTSKCKTQPKPLDLYLCFISYFHYWLLVYQACAAHWLDSFSFFPLGNVHVHKTLLSKGLFSTALAQTLPEPSSAMVLTWLRQTITRKLTISAGWVS